MMSKKRIKWGPPGNRLGVEPDYDTGPQRTGDVDWQEYGWDGVGGAVRATFRALRARAGEAREVLEDEIEMRRALAEMERGER